MNCSHFSERRRSAIRNSLAGLLFFVLAAFTISDAKADGLVDATNRFVWSESSGWINFAPANQSVSVAYNGTNRFLTGYVWGENIGYIRLSSSTNGPFLNTTATNWGINLNTSGMLSGFAWGENIGWINFGGSNSVVQINATNGFLQGYAWGENIGWMRFHSDTNSAVIYGLRTGIVSIPPNIPGDLDGDGTVSLSEFAAVYTASTTNVPSASMTNVTGLGDTNISFSLAAPLLRPFAIEYTTDLVNWTPLGSVPPRYLFIDTNAPALSQRYYRLRIVSIPSLPGDANGDGIVSPSEVDAAYANYVANSSWINTTNVADPGNRVSFSLSTPPDVSYLVESSTNLATWPTLRLTTPYYEFTDTNAPAIPQRYYRLRTP